MRRSCPARLPASIDLDEVEGAFSAIAGDLVVFRFAVEGNFSDEEFSRFGVEQAAVFEGPEALVGLAVETSFDDAERALPAGAQIHPLRWIVAAADLLDVHHVALKGIVAACAEAKVGTA